MRRTLAVLLSCFSFASSSYGWNGFGHMAVAYVAYQHLQPPAKARADKLLRLNPSYAAWKSKLPAGLTPDQQNLMLFMIAATWPDQIRGDKSYKADGPAGGNQPPALGGNENLGYSDKNLHKYWHFVNTPISQDGTPVEPSLAPNAETQIKILAPALESKAPSRVKSYDLVWLLHLVGDVHQPLHNAARFTKVQPHGDAGGNLVLLNPPPCKGAEKVSELHALWDGAVGNSDNVQEVITVAAVLPPQNVTSTDLDVDVWITESALLAQSKVYRAPVGDSKGPYTIDQAYCEQMRTVAEQRIVQAGLRLANLLNTYLK